MYSLLGILTIELALRFLLVDGINPALSAGLFLALGIAVVVAAREDVYSRFIGLVGLHLAFVIALARLPEWVGRLAALPFPADTPLEILPAALALVYLLILPLGLLLLPILAGMERMGYGAWRWRPFQ